MALSHRLGIPFERSTYPIRSTSIYFVYMVPATIYAFGQMLGDNHRKLYSVLFVTLFATCFLTAFRKVWLGVFFGIIFYALFYEKTRGVMSRMLALLSPLLVFSLYLIHSVAPESTAARIEAYESTIRFVMNNPLGVGHGGVEQITGWTAHNILLDAFSKYGIGAFALLLTICIISVLQAVRVGKHSSNIVIMSLAASIIALLIGLQFENSYTMQRFWLILGLFYASIDIDVASDSNDIA